MEGGRDAKMVGRRGGGRRASAGMRAQPHADQQPTTPSQSRPSSSSQPAQLFAPEASQLVSEYIPVSQNASVTAASTPNATVSSSSKRPRLIIRHTPTPKSKGKEREREYPVSSKVAVDSRYIAGGGVKGEDNKENSICVSRFLMQEDYDRMPSLEAAIRREGRRRRASGEVVVAGTTDGNVNGVSRGRARSQSQPQNKAITNGYTSGTSSSTSASSSVSKAQPDPSRKISKHEKPLERNIDTVIFGDVTFKAWYPSWYPKEIIGEKALNGESKGIVVPELYICKRCFGYGKVLVDWVRHCRCCEKGVPGERVYSHGVGRGGGDPTWTVWEVDGSADTLFCQNLSLFAKLFLDNKSVFFDVQGFNYFLLVHTCPPSSPTPNAQQIVGFFSKEKMSWDNNNLACILIFPPWQRKGLGALLMGVSYSIARREGILGGPEKPISELGRKGYKRYWGAEIARWLLSVKESDKKKSKGMVNVKEISKETWIAPEDCLAVLRDMGVVEKAGRGKGTVERVRVDKARVREWLERERIGLESVVFEEGFLERYAMKEAEGEDEDEEMGG